MRLFPPPLEIGAEEGFTKEKDIFGRSSIGRGLTNVVCRVTDPLVIAVDNEWGTGKTTFLKMWAGELRKLEIPVIYFDAFQHDYVEDAFTAIAAEIISLALQKQKESEPATQKLIKSSVSTAKILLRSSLKLGVKLGTAGILDAADLENVAKDLAQEVSDLEDKYLGEILTKQKQEKDAIQSFRDSLQVLPSLLTSGKPIQDAAKAPLVIIIDELDRCRPDFALQILERIKHFFSTPGVHFVLGAHLGQLQNSVSAVYGAGVDSAKYLQKFVNLTLHLTESNWHPHQRATAIYIDHLFASMEIHSNSEFSSDYAKDYLHHLAHHRRLSLRVIERIITNLAIALAYRPKNTFCLPPLLLGLCALKVLSPGLYVQAKAGNLIFNDARETLAMSGAPEPNSKYSIEHMIKSWRYYSDPSVAEDNPEFQAFGRGLWDFGLARSNAVAAVARVVDRMSE